MMIATIENNKTGMPLLRLSLALDAVVTGMNGLAYLVAATVLDDVLGLQANVLQGIGAFLLVYGVAVGALASRDNPNPVGVAAVIGANALWATASVVFAFASDSLTTVGTVWTLLQAGVVGGFAALQVLGLRARRSTVSR